MTNEKLQLLYIYPIEKDNVRRDIVKYVEKDVLDYVVIWERIQNRLRRGFITEGVVQTKGLCK